MGGTFLCTNQNHVCRESDNILFRLGSKIMTRLGFNEYKEFWAVAASVVSVNKDSLEKKPEILTMKLKFETRLLSNYHQTSP